MPHGTPSTDRRRQLDTAALELELPHRIAQALCTPGRQAAARLKAALAALGDRPGICRASLAIAARGTEAGQVLLWDRMPPDRGPLAHSGVTERLLRGVVERGEAAVASGAQQEPIFVDGHLPALDPEAAPGVSVSVPVRHRDAVIGALAVDLQQTRGTEIRGELRLLSVAAVLMSSTLDQLLQRPPDSGATARRGVTATGSSPVAEPHMVGASRQIQQVLDMVRQVARSSTTVLIRGESGTGKELVARAVHAQSPRCHGPFVPVNCAALPEALVESELFGHVRGAYTGASSARKGRFELAEGGTLFLDEIGELSSVLQAKLLRVLQEREIERVGGETSRPVDVRIIAATNASLETQLAAGRFREDLYYRLNVFPICVPPLRERRADITLLADHFLEKHAALSDKRVVRISTPAIDLLTSYHWPGNVRELESCISRAVLLTEDGVVREHHLPATLQTGSSTGTTREGSFRSMMLAYERELLVEAMRNAGGNQSKAARALDTTPRILAYRLKRLGLHAELTRRSRVPGQATPSHEPDA